MLNGVGSVTNTPPTTPVAKNAKAAQPQAAPEKQDSVHLSSAAQNQAGLLKAAIQEATETPAQTSREARSGDRQAQRVLAKAEAANERAGGK